jgi:hypothetical protein
MLIFLVTLNCNVFDVRSNKPCENACLVCQKTIYKLKFQKSPGCGSSHCKTTCKNVWALWNRPQTPFGGFQGDTLGKCDSCFRAGFCSITECSAQKALEKTVIEQVVNKAKLSGFVDSSALDSMLKKVMKNKPVNFRKYAKKIKKQVKKTTKPNVFKKNFKKIAETLKLLAGASSSKDLKLALNQVNAALKKSKTTQTVKDSIRKLASNFNTLIQSKRNSPNKKGSSRKILKTAKKVKNYIKRELKNLLAYSNRLKKSKDQVQSVIQSLKNQTIINAKTQKKIAKLQKILTNLNQVLSVLSNTEKDINKTLAVIKQAAAQFKN